MLDADVADVSAPQGAKSPDRAAIAYLIASNATAIQIIENETGCTFRVGTKIDARAASVHWLRETEARAVLKAARRGAGESPDIATATSALIEAAARLRVTLSDHRVAIERAAAMSAQLDAYVASLRARGGMREFTKMYKRRRIAAVARGEGFMSFGNAELRFKRALIPLLQGGATVAPTQGLFASIFDSK
jgi:hypothetical protein